MAPEADLQFAELLAVEAVEAARVYGSGNSQVYRLSDTAGRVWCGKVYADPVPGRRDRLATEWQAFRFLHDHGVAVVPKPVACDAERKIAVYSWVEGNRFSDRIISLQDIDSAVGFLEQLDDLRDVPAAAQLPLASEACFSVEHLAQNLCGRMRILLDADATSSGFEEMRAFVRGELSDLCNRFEECARHGYDRLGRSPQAELPASERVLSPSDFGFHNAIHTGTGTVWLDFEYFGWDDPAKTMADFVLHPAMNLDFAARRRFWQKMAGRFGAVGDLAERARLLYPLYGIKWCLIMLNEFLSDGIERRRKAGSGAIAADDLRRRQLAKARNLLNTLAERNESFPFN
jgi:hypothetical protein